MTHYQVVTGSIAAAAAVASLVFGALLQRDRSNMRGGKLPFSGSLDWNFQYFNPRNFSREAAPLVYGLWVAQAVLAVAGWAFMSSLI